MEQRVDTLRERLLSRLPQPENLAAFREETASLLARHERALFWENWSTRLLALSFIGILLVSDSIWGPKLDPAGAVVLRVIAAVMFFLAGIYSLREFIYRNQVSLLKEIKQVQLQILELQASLRKDSPPQI
jgi:hypothetical protein